MHRDQPAVGRTHGGTIRAESTPGKGSVFTVVLYFPVAPDVRGVDLFTKPDLMPIPSAVTPAKPEGPPWDTAELCSLLERLKRSLASEEPRLYMEILEALLQRPCPEGQDAVLAEMNRLVQCYRLAEALALLEKEYKDDGLVKSPFSPPLAGGDEGEGGNS